MPTLEESREAFDFAESYNSCSEATAWCKGKTLQEAWEQCERGDWMLWIAGCCGVDRKLLVLAACKCAELALVHVPAGELRPQAAITTAIACDAAYAYAAYAYAAAAAAASAADAAYAAAAAGLSTHIKCAELAREVIPWDIAKLSIEQP